VFSVIPSELETGVNGAGIVIRLPFLKYNIDHDELETPRGLDSIGNILPTI